MNSCRNIKNKSPGKPYLSCKFLKETNNFKIEITMPYGGIADYWKLYEDDVVICEDKIADKYEKPQYICVEVKNMPPSIYIYKCKLINEYGYNVSDSMVIDTRVDNINYPSNFRVNYYKDDLIVFTWDRFNNGEQYDISINESCYSNVNYPFSYRFLNKGVYNFRIKTVKYNKTSSWSKPFVISTINEEITNVNKKIIVSYWKNYNNINNIRLRGAVSDIDILNVSHATFEKGSSRVVFKPFNVSENEFINDIKYLKLNKTKVCLELAGEIEDLPIKTKSQEDEFVDSLICLIKKYKFNGLNISLSGKGISLLPEDKDFENPKTMEIIYLINGIKRVVNSIDRGLILILSPEMNFVQGGAISYKYTSGAYLPIIYGLKDILTLVYTRIDNFRTLKALDGIAYRGDTIDFHIAMVEMLINGFEIEGNKNKRFIKIPEYKVLLGLNKKIKCSCCKNLSILMEKAFNSLILGDELYEVYKMINTGGYKKFKGMVAFDVNWKDYCDLKFLREARYYLDNI